LKFNQIDAEVFAFQFVPPRFSREFEPLSSRLGIRQSGKHLTQKMFLYEHDFMRKNIFVAMIVNTVV